MEQALSVLGVDAIALRVYRHLLENPRWLSGGITDEASSAVGLSAHEHATVMATLEERGLVRRTGAEAGGWSAVDPVIGIERLIERTYAELNDLLRQVTATRAVLPELAESFQQGKSRLAPIDIERLEGLEEVRARLDDLAFFAREEVVALQPSFSPKLIEACRPLDMRCLRRGVKLRTILSKEAVDNPVTLAYLQETVALGAEVRFTDRPLDRMVAYDRKLAVVPVDPGDSSRGALVISQPGVLAGMIRLFEELWGSAEDISRLSSPKEEELSDAERMVLKILCEVEKDEVGARQMGVSLRTFRRYVADLMVRLEASNRFHAAMLAKERGWI